jgi:hypothetical protein
MISQIKKTSVFSSDSEMSFTVAHRQVGTAQLFVSTYSIDCSSLKGLKQRFKTAQMMTKMFEANELFFRVGKGARSSEDMKSLWNSCVLDEEIKMPKEATVFFINLFSTHFDGVVHGDVKWPSDSNIVTIKTISDTNPMPSL